MDSNKAQLGLEMILKAKEKGIPFAFVGMDAYYGEQPWLLTQLEQSGLVYMADIPCDTRVYLEYPRIGIPKRRGKRGKYPSKLKVLQGESVEVRELLSSDKVAWHVIKVKKKSTLTGKGRMLNMKTVMNDSRIESNLAELDSFQSTLGVTFKDITYLQQSLTHRSYLNESCSPLTSNERVEFLGDALLSFVTAEKLYSSFPDLPEGDLTKLRSSLVRTETLARIARSLNIGNYLYLGRGEDESGGRDRQRNLAGALEAVVGAIFLDQGFRVTRKFILRILSKELKQITKGEIEEDPKSRLQQVVQARQQLPPIYQVVDITGPEHERKFTVEAVAGQTVLGRGRGRRKRAAEREAARKALKNLEKNHDQHI